MNNSVWIMVQGDYYKIVNKIKKLNIEIYSAVKKKDCCYFKLNYNDYILLKKRFFYYKVSLIKENGLKRFYKIIKKYNYYLLAFIIGLFILLFLSNIIVSVEVIHSSKEIRTLVTDALEEQGIKKLTFKKSYNDLEIIKKIIIDKYQDKIEWMEIENHGMKYIVRVEQRIINHPNIHNSYCHIIAKKSGVITDIVTKKGEALVTRNTYVNKGDILVSGDINFNNEIKSFVCANATVKAEVWYTVKVSMPLDEFSSYLTGKKRINFAYDRGLGKKLLLKSPFKKYKISYKRIFKIFNNSLYLVIEQEQKMKKHHYSDYDALKQAIILALEKINIKKDEQDKVITQKVLKKTINNSTIDLEVFFAIEEEIGIEKTLDRDGEVS